MSEPITEKELDEWEGLAEPLGPYLQETAFLRLIAEVRRQRKGSEEMNRQLDYKQAKIEEQAKEIERLVSANEHWHVRVRQLNDSLNNAEDKIDDLETAAP